MKSVTKNKPVNLTAHKTSYNLPNATDTTAEVKRAILLHEAQNMDLRKLPDFSVNLVSLFNNIRDIIRRVRKTKPKTIEEQEREVEEKEREEIWR